MKQASCVWPAVVAVVILGLSCAEPAPPPVVPEPEMTDMEPQVAKRLRETRAAVVADSGSAIAWGRFGMVAHAHELLDEAEAAYREAEILAPDDVRWPYFLGDVLSITGTDLAGAESAFRRAMAQREDYAPAHLRLGRVLVAAGKTMEAEVELERALLLAPDLQPARVALAQLKLTEGDAEAAASLLEEVLAVAPRHEQALATLGRAYMRLGRRDEARSIAERASDPAAYNLYSDPLMGQVVAEGVSVVLIWERAKAFLESGNNQQAVLGLIKVVELQPSNVDAHHQLATAYGNLRQLDGARRHLELTVGARPESVEARMQLATVYLDQGEPDRALVQLRSVVDLAPEEPDAEWLLARATVETGDVEGGLLAFERASRGGAEVPGWAHDEWGRLLAQSGRPEEALVHFRSALDLNPEDAQALFFMGLVFEGYGQVNEAVEYYCRSLVAVPNSPSTVRLSALGRACS